VKINTHFAIVYVALCALSTGATGQNVFKCGNAYSQKPCAEGVVLDVQDARTAEQKAASDALIKRDSAAANAMEKARLKEEAQQRADNAKWAATVAKKSKTSESTEGAVSDHTTKVKKKSVKKKKEPDYFRTQTATKPSRKASSASK
jgi:protein subunit release factor B